MLDEIRIKDPQSAHQRFEFDGSAYHGIKFKPQKVLVIIVSSPCCLVPWIQKLNRKAFLRFHFLKNSPLPISRDVDLDRLNSNPEDQGTQRSVFLFPSEGGSVVITNHEGKVQLHRRIVQPVAKCSNMNVGNKLGKVTIIELSPGLKQLEIIFWQAPFEGLE